MNRTNIEWTDYTWNPITGCLHGCPYCYAKKITQRFKKNYPAGFLPTFYPERIADPLRLKKPSRIFTVSMGDMFGEWVEPEWIEQIMNTILLAERHQFQILTKNPTNATKLLDMALHAHGLAYPENLWLGTTVENNDAAHRIQELPQRMCFRGGLRFVSFEPLLGPVTNPDLSNIDWIIIGAQTNPKDCPEGWWVGDLIDAARDEKIPVFLKNSIQWWWPDKIQQFPQTGAR